MELLCRLCLNAASEKASGRRPSHGSLRERGWTHIFARGQGYGHTATVRNWRQINRSGGKGANRQNGEKKQGVLCRLRRLGSVSKFLTTGPF